MKNAHVGPGQEVVDLTASDGDDKAASKKESTGKAARKLDRQSKKLDNETTKENRIAEGSTEDAPSPVGDRKRRIAMDATNGDATTVECTEPRCSHVNTRKKVCNSLYVRHVDGQHRCWHHDPTREIKNKHAVDFDKLLEEAEDRKRRRAQGIHREASSDESLGSDSRHKSSDYEDWSSFIDDADEASPIARSESGAVDDGSGYEVRSALGTAQSDPPSGGLPALLQSVP